MTWRLYLPIFLVPIAIVVIAAVFLLITRSGGDPEPTVGLTAAATLESPSGDAIGTVTFRQVAAGVLVAVEARGLAPGGHAFIIHETGACTPDFDAAGDHFNPTDAEHGFIHPNWSRGEATGGHGGDLPISTPPPTVPPVPTSSPRASPSTSARAIPSLTTTAPPSSCTKSPTPTAKRSPTPAPAWPAASSGTPSDPCLRERLQSLPKPFMVSLSNHELPFDRLRANV